MAELTIDRAEQMGREDGSVVCQRAREAIAFASAYEPRSRVLVVDGSMFSPSTRALPRASVVWETEGFETWEAYQDAAQAVLDEFTEPDDSDSEAPGDWVLVWEDGMLLAIAPYDSQED